MTDAIAYIISKKQHSVYSFSQYEILCKTSQPTKLAHTQHLATLANTNAINRCICTKV